MNKNKALVQPTKEAIARIGLVSAIVLSISLIINASPALAHHPNGGEIPSYFR